MGRGKRGCDMCRASACSPGSDELRAVPQRGVYTKARPLPTYLPRHAPYFHPQP